MPAGRPTKYTPKIVNQARNYLVSYNEEHKHNIPSIVGLAKIINVARSTLYKWADEEGKEFSDILENIEDYQHFELTEKGLEGKFNSTITKLMLTKHGYSDKSENTHSIPDGISFNMNYGPPKCD